MDKSPITWKYGFTPETWRKFIALLLEGNNQIAALREIGVNAQALVDFLSLNPGVKDSYVSAKENGFDAMADSLLSMHETIQDAQKARLASENKRWYLSKRAAHKYGDRMEVNMTGQIDLNAALAEATKRLSSDSSNTITLPSSDYSTSYDAEPTDIKSLDDLLS